MPHPNAKKRDREMAAKHRAIYRAAVIEAKPRAEVLEKFGIGERHLLRIIARQDRLLRQEFPEHIARIKDKQTRQLEWIYEEAIQAWERSKQDAESVTDVDGDGKTETRKTRKGQVGNPAYLDAAMKALEDIRRIWGVEAPKKLDVSGNIGLLVTNTPAPTREHLKEVLAKRILTLTQERKATTHDDGSDSGDEPDTDPNPDDNAGANAPGCGGLVSPDAQ